MAPPSKHPPADARRRLIARAIDLGVAFAPLLLVPRGHPRAGEWLSLGLLLCNDSLFGPGRSLGKRLAGLRVIALSGRSANIRESILRNAIFALGLLPLNPPFCAIAFAAISAFEAGIALRPLTKDFGRRRIGDLLAHTQVIDASIAIPLATPRPVEARPAAAPLASRAA
jgi:uncharacterized RDD family membrane protein YckC